MSEKYRTTAFFNGVSSFRTAFPALDDAVVEWRERRSLDDERSSDLRKTGFRRGNFVSGVLSCSNPACREGGYQIDRLIAEMVGLQETEREGIMLCAGREAGEEVRRGPIPCPHRIEFKVTLIPQGDEHRPGPSPGRRGRNRPRRRRAA